MNAIKKYLNNDFVFYKDLSPGDLAIIMDARSGDEGTPVIFTKVGAVISLVDGKTIPPEYKLRKLQTGESIEIFQG